MKRVSRRVIISATALTAASSLVEASARTITGEVPWVPGEANSPSHALPGGYKFFTPQEAAFVEAVVARLIPADELGPGAKEANVPVFLDRQLSGPYGRAERWYMQGPWAKGTKSQGYQTRFTPAQLYRAAIKSIDEQCRARFQNKAFAELAAEQQDSLLKELEDGKLKLDGVPADAFFELLLQNTTEGFFCDPIHGGNRDMIGWKLIGFPGARYDYRPYVAKHNQKLDLPPVGIGGRPGWNPKS